MAVTRTNQEWLEDLSAEGERQSSALDDLRDLLLRTVLYFFSHNLGDLGGLPREEILQLAEDCAQDALLAILAHLKDFRGDSKFTTWTYKFAVNIALMTARRERYKGVSLEQLTTADEGTFFEWMTEDRSPGLSPDRSALQGEIGDALREVIEAELTDKQREVLSLMVFNEVPMDEVVRRLDTNRNAVYKLLHDARSKLKSGLLARGFEVGETLALFSAEG